MELSEDLFNAHEFIRTQKPESFQPHIDTTDLKNHETQEVIDFLWRHFKEFAKGIILYYLGQSEHTEEIASFYNNPDDPQEHAPQYHQWGIITHSKKFEEFFRTKVPQYLLTWRNEHMLEDLKNEEIDGKSKYDLMQISIPMHDYGKFAVRKTWHQANGTFHSFGGHEASSGTIIRGELFQKWLQDTFQLTPSQIEYIAQCAELHYELGIVRNGSKQFANGFSFSFLETPECTEAIQELAAKYTQKNMAREVGLLFLADSLAKTDIVLPASTDQQLQSYGRTTVEHKIKMAGANPHLYETVLYRPVNIELAKKYLSLLPAA